MGTKASYIVAYIGAKESQCRIEKVGGNRYVIAISNPKKPTFLLGQRMWGLDKERYLYLELILEQKQPMLQTLINWKLEEVLRHLLVVTNSLVRAVDVPGPLPG